MYLNKVFVIGIVEKAPQLSYPSTGNPVCAFTLVIKEDGPSGQTFTSYIPVEVVGKVSEDVAASLDAGDLCCIEGRLKYRSQGQNREGKKVGGLIISTWMRPSVLAAAAVSTN